MTLTPDKPPDRGSDLGITPLGQQKTDATTGTSSGLGDSAKLRSFAQIIAEEAENRNILKMTKQQISEDGETKLAQHLTIEDVSVLVFDAMKLKPEQCLGIALSTSRYDTKEANLKPGVDVTP